MAIDWTPVDKANAEHPQRSYKNYAPNGRYTVRLAEAVVDDRDGWKSPRLTFIWAEDDQYKYPRSVAHWLSLDNPNWRHRNHLAILKSFGIEEAKAKQLIETAEQSEDRIKMADGYVAMYKKVAERKLTTEIEVQDQYRDGKPVLSDKGTPFSESDLTAYNARVMQVHKEEPLAGAQEVTLDEESPF